MAKKGAWLQVRRCSGPFHAAAPLSLVFPVDAALSLTDYQNGNMVCKRCATVVQDQIVSDAPEWRTFTEEER